MKNRPLILASNSPRRLDLLKQIGIVPDQIFPANLDETPLKNEQPRDLALRLSIAKASSVLPSSSSFVLAADTVVACGRRILPKTETEEEARACLSLLSGRRHRVYGGIAIRTPEGKMLSRVTMAVVEMKRLCVSEIDHYIALREWKGKAGGYAIQGHAAAFIPFIRGTYSGVVGLSVYDTIQMLAGSGFFLSES